MRRKRGGRFLWNTAGRTEIAIRRTWNLMDAIHALVQAVFMATVWPYIVRAGKWLLSWWLNAWHEARERVYGSNPG